MAPDGRAMDVVGDVLYVGLTLGFLALTWAFVRLCERVEEAAMPLIYVMGGLVSLGLLVYLVVALLEPERFA